MKKTRVEKEPEALACRRKTTIGGQALIEGLMMIGPEKKAMAVRLPDGSVLVEEIPIASLSGAANIPFIRGCVRLFHQLVGGTKALMRSAELAEDEETLNETPEGHAVLSAATAVLTQTSADDRPEETTEKITIKKRMSQAIDRFFSAHTDWLLYGSAVIGILFSVILFILLPNFLVSLIHPLLGMNPVLSNLIEGLIRIGLFVSYLALANRMEDIKRVWMYHGAEHKAIACYEAELPLTVENARIQSRFHPRCGTAFMFLVILLSIIVFSLIGWWSRWLNLLIRFALVPVLAGMAYELIRLAGRYDNWLTRLISKPGLWLQHLTTAEPDDGMLEVALAALEAVRPIRSDSDQW